MGENATERDGDFEARALAYVSALDELANDVTQALGLPGEEKYTVLRSVHGRAAHAMTAMTEQAVSEELRQSSDAAEDEAGETSSLYRLTSEFLRRHLTGELQRFEILWRSIKQLPLEAVADNTLALQRSSAGLAFTGTDSELLPVLSTTAWWLDFHQSHQQEAPTPELAARVAREAHLRGCSRQLGGLLTAYLLAKLQHMS